MMRTFKAIAPSIVVLGLVGVAPPAAAQMYPGDDVIVNPNGIPNSNLLQPGQPYPGLHLKPPSAHRHHHRAAPKPSAETAAANTDTAAPAATTETSTAAPAAEPAPVAPTKSKHRSTATTTNSAAAESGPTNPIPFTFGGDSTETPPAAAPTAKIARTELPPPQTHTSASSAEPSGLTKRGEIRFEHNATDPTPSQMDGIKLLAGDLNSAIEAGATHIQLQAFAGAPGDKSSDARRVSLKRALAIRQILIDNGVPAGRIDVQAMGGATDKGEQDRVDVYVKAS